MKDDIITLEKSSDSRLLRIICCLPGECDSIIRQEHYLHRIAPQRGKIRYRIINEDGDILVVIEWALAHNMVLLRFPFLLITEIAENTRFLVRTSENLKSLFQEAPEKFINLGTRSLSLARKEIMKDWPYDSLKLMLTYVDPARHFIGAVYKADNWRQIGNSAGKNWNKRKRIDYHPNAKLTFIRRLNSATMVGPIEDFDKDFIRAHFLDLNKLSAYNYHNG